MEYQNPKVTSFRDLIIWQKGNEIALAIYQFTKQLPKEELCGLTSQLRRAAVSVPSNIAEGRGRNTRKDFLQFLHITQGSLAELETQFMFACTVYKINDKHILKLIEEEQKMLAGMIKKLKANS